MKLLTFFTLLCFACAQGAPIENVEILPTEDLESAPIGEHFDDCSRAFSPDEGSRKYVEAAVARWSYTTGCNIHISDNGIPVRLVPELYKYEDPTDEVWGKTRIDGNDKVFLIEISEKSPHPYATTAHELGHAISGLDPDVTDGHSETGLMASPIIDDTIDESTLNVICSEFRCREFNEQVAPQP